MNIKFLILIGLIITQYSSAGFALQFKVYDANNELQIINTSSQNLELSVFQLTKKILSETNILFESTELGIISIFNIGSRLVTVSETEFKAFGWCYAVNGVSPEKMPNEIYLQNQADEITWYYGYAAYKNGQWLTQCATDLKL